MYFRHFPRIDYDIDGSGTFVNLPSITSFASVKTKKLLDNVAFYSYYNVSDGDRPDNVSEKLYGTPKYYWTFFLVNDELKNYYDDWPKGNAVFRDWVEDKYTTLAAITSAQGGSDDTIHGKFDIGEVVQGAVSGATGYLIGKYPTQGFIEIEPIAGTFAEQEGIQGVTSADFISTEKIVKKSRAPHHHIDLSTDEITMRRTAGTRAVTYYEYEEEKELANSRIRVIKPEFIRKVVDEFISELGN